MQALKTAGIIGIVFISLIAVLGTTLIFVEPLRNEAIFSYYYYAGNFSDAQKAAMKNARSEEPANFVFENDGDTYVFPLPNGATEWPDGGWLVINYEFYGSYYERITAPEPIGDFTYVAQLGGGIVFTSNDGKLRLDFGFGNIARRYEHLDISVSMS